jgi:hypothetical protein
VQILADLDLPRAPGLRNSSGDPNYFVREINQLWVLGQFFQLAPWPDTSEEGQSKVTNQFAPFELGDMVLRARGLFPGLRLRYARHLS